MIKFAKRAIATVVTALFLTTGANAASKNSVDILKYIPADTPYVIASTESLPKDLIAKFEPTVDEVMQAYQSILRHVMEEKLAKLSADEDGAEKSAHIRGIAEELISLMSLEGIRGAGIESGSAFAFYGNGLLPVWRFELTDSDLFDAAVGRIEEKAGELLSVDETNGKSYKYFEVEKTKILLATIDEQAIITVVPSSYDEAQIASALGVKKPRKNLKRSKALRAIAKEYGFSGLMSGYIDIQRIAGIFTGGATDNDKAMFEALGKQPPELSAICSAEIMETAGIAPRVVFGYSDVTAQQLKSSMIVELREDIATGLATIPAAVPGLGFDPGGLMSFGFGLDPMALRAFYESRLDAMEAAPYECEKFADLQAGVAKGREALNQPIPPVVYSFRGFVANIADIQGMDLASKTPPESIDASILIAIENAESLVMMAAMMDPQIAALNLIPDGTPVKLELAKLSEYVDVAFAALSKDALAVSLGDGAEANSANMLVAESSDEAPFMSMSMDSARYYSMIGEAMAKEQPETEEGDQTSLAIQTALSDIMTLSGSLYERMSVEVRFTERGIEIDGTMTLSD